MLGVGAGAAPATAAEIRAGGAPGLTLSGFAAVEAHGGALDDQRLDPELSRDPDLSTDTEIDVLARARDDRTGIDYGAVVELEADTDTEENAGKSWVFLRSRFGELRLGDEDGPVRESALGGFTVAAGTGGIDGDVVDQLVVDAVSPTDTDVATKVRYYTPIVAGFQLGASYTPNADEHGATPGTRDVAARDWVEGALVYQGELDPVELQASVVGSRGRVEDQDAFGGKDDLWAWYAGGVVGLDELELGAGFGQESIGGLGKRYLNLGVAYGFENASVSITYGRVLRTRNQAGVGEPWNVALSADTPLLPGLELQGDVAYFDNDLDPGTGRPGGGDRGWVWVTRLELTF